MATHGSSRHPLYLKSDSYPDCSFSANLDARVDGQPGTGSLRHSPFFCWPSGAHTTSLNLARCGFSLNAYTTIKERKVSFWEGYEEAGHQEDTCPVGEFTVFLSQNPLISSMLRAKLIFCTTQQSTCFPPQACVLIMAVLYQHSFHHNFLSGHWLYLCRCIKF